jgi:hypothetical protein
MTWFRNHLTVARLCILALLIIALLGPWAFDLLSVPVESACQPPTVRIDSRFCGYPMSGLTAVFSMIPPSFALAASLVTGKLNVLHLGNEWLTLLFWLPLLALLSLALRIAWPKLRGWLGFHLAILGLAAVASGVYISFIPANRIWIVWGLWLFLTAALAALILELSSLMGRQKAA